MTQAVQHDQEHNKFFITKDLSEAYLTYEQVSDGVLDFKSTFVPAVFRGRGMAEDLVKAGLGYARDNRYTVIPTCSYVDAYIRRHPDEYGPLLAQKQGRGGSQIL
jgi:uncharacterized protein